MPGSCPTPPRPGAPLRQSTAPDFPDFPDFGDTERVDWCDPLIPMVAQGAAPDCLSQRAPQQVTGARTTRDAVGCSSPALVDALPIVHEGRIDLGLRLGCAGASDVRYARDDSGRLSADLDRDGDLVEGRAVCVPAHSGSGCAAGGTSSPTAGLAWMCLALVLARRRWRKR